MKTEWIDIDPRFSSGRTPVGSIIRIASLVLFFSFFYFLARFKSYEISIMFCSFFSWLSFQLLGPIVFDDYSFVTFGKLEDTL